MMGMLQGYPRDNTMYIMDIYCLPVIATMTSVQMDDRSLQFMVAYNEMCKSVDRLENIVGWYHSHPGYGCFLSGQDVKTQREIQQMLDPALALVIDPNQTSAAGKVELGCFRTFTEDYAEKNKDTKVSAKGLEMMDGEILKTFGVHAHHYYKVEHSVFKSSIDDLLLKRLWNDYWVDTLSTSPLLTNAKQMVTVKSEADVIKRGDDKVEEEVQENLKIRRVV